MDARALLVRHHFLSILTTMPKGIIIFVVFITVLVSGCASLNANTPFRYQPFLLTSNTQIDNIAGLNLFLDHRPKNDITYTKNISDIPEKITAKLLEDFNSSHIFKELHYPSRDNDDIVINGKINRFTWKLYSTPLGYIPFLSYLGISTLEAYGIADITLEIKDNRNGNIIATIQESTAIKNAFSVYNFKIGDSGSELEDAFRDVGKKLKKALLQKLGAKQ